MLLKNKSIFTIGVICLVFFIGIAAYLWYLYFKEYEGKIIAENDGLAFMRAVEFENSGPIYYINADVLDPDNVIPKYYFRVKNSSDKDYEYYLYIEDSNGNDGCNANTRFKRSDLQYELRLDNQLLKNGSLDSISDNLLYVNTVEAGKVNDYSLKIWLKDDVEDYEDLHYHYIITMKEKR